MDEDNNRPQIILIFSGKRKSGKDYLANLLVNKYGSFNVAVIHIAGPIKERYAALHHVDFARLCDSSNFKEQYRANMIELWEQQFWDNEDALCKEAVARANAHGKPIWIVADARRKDDLAFFKANYPQISYSVRVVASEDVRHQRGWCYVEGIDDGWTECELDTITIWDFRVWNDNNEVLFQEHVQKITNKIDAAILRTSL